MKQESKERYLILLQMIEPELAFADLNDDMACATAYLQFVVCYLYNYYKVAMVF